MTVMIINSDQNTSIEDNIPQSNTLLGIQNDSKIESSHYNKPFNRMMLQAFSIACYCVSMNSILKKPLILTKVALHTELNLSTIQLSHIDVTFLLFRTVGHLIIPMVDESYWRTFLFDCFLLISIIYIIIPIFPSFYLLLLSYVIVGLSSSNFFPIIMNNIMTWLPKKLFVKLVLFWVASQSIGSCFGIAICTFSIRIFGWRSCYIAVSLLLILSAFLIRNVYVDPSKVDNQSDVELHPLGSVPMITQSEGIFDSLYSIITNMAKPIFKYRNTDNVEDINVSTIWKQRFTGLIDSIKGIYIHLLENSGNFKTYFIKICKNYRLIFSSCPRLFLLFITYFFMDLISYFYAFWLPFYLTTQLNYESEMASDISVALYIGDIIGTILTSLTTDFVPPKHRITLTSFWCFSTFISILIFLYFVHSGTFFVIIVTVLVSTTNTGCVSIISTLTIYDVFKNSGLDESLLSMTCNILLSFGSIGAVFQSYLAIALANKFGWSSVFYSCSFISFISAILMFCLYLLETRPSLGLPN